MCAERVEKEEDSRVAVKAFGLARKEEERGVRANVYVNFSFCTRTHSLNREPGAGEVRKGELSRLICVRKCE